MKSGIKLLLVALITIRSAALAASVDNYIAAKGQQFFQTNAAAPVLVPASEPFRAHASVTPTAMGVLTGATLRLPAGNTLAMELEEDGSYSLETAYTNKAQLDAQAPAGTYNFAMFQAAGGTNLAALTLPKDAYPPTPWVSNWLDAQEVDQSQPFTVTWLPFTNGTAGDYILLEVDQPNDGDAVWSTPLLFQPGAVNGTNTSALIPANTLEAGHEYEGRLLFVKRTTLNTNSIPGATGLGGYYKQTVFPIHTLAEPPAEGLYQFSARGYAANENEAGVWVTVTRAGGDSFAGSVRVATGPGTATVGADYSSLDVMLNFDPGISSREFRVPFLDDFRLESNETFTVTLSQPSGSAVLGTRSSAVVTILDNEKAAAGTLQFSPAALTLAETGPAALLTVRRTGGSTGSVSVNYHTMAGTAASDADFTATNGTLTFAAAQTSQILRVPIRNDSLDESNEVFTVVLDSSAGGAALGTNLVATVTITDNDDGGVIAFKSAALVTNENSGLALVTVARTVASGQTPASAASVAFLSLDGSATDALDYFATNGTLVFASNELSKTFTVVITNDTLAENDETVLLKLMNPAGGARLGAISNATLTLRDDESSVRFTNAAYTISEAGRAIAINVIRSGALLTPVSVNFSTGNGSATSTNDYRGTNGTLLFPANTAFKTISIPIANDTLVDSNETFSVFLHSPSNGVQLGTLTNTVVTITDNDAGGVLAFSAANYNNPEAGPAAAITVSRTGGIASGVSVWFTTTDGSATAPGDYTTVSNKLTFNAGETSKTITVPVMNDALDETNEIVNLALSGVEGGARLGTNGTATLTIVDNDTAGGFRVGIPAYTTNENAGAFTITVSRTGGAASGVTLDYFTQPGTASANLDFTPANGTLVFASNELSRILAVPVLNDTSPEGNETLTFTITNATGGATITTNHTATLTIVDDESSVSFSNAAYTVSEAGGALAINVLRSGALGTAVSVNYATLNASAAAPGDFTATNGTLNFPANTALRTITVPIINDALTESPENFSVRLNTPLGGVQLGAITNTIVNITDDDQPGTIRFAASTFTGSEGGTASVTIIRTGGTAAGVTVQFNTFNGTAGGLDYTSASQLLTFAAGETNKTVLVTLKTDNLTEPVETVQLSLTSPGGGSTLGTPNTAVLNINNASGITCPAVTFNLTAPGMKANTSGGAFTTAGAGGANSISGSLVHGILTINGIQAGTTTRTISIVLSSIPVGSTGSFPMSANSDFAGYSVSTLNLSTFCSTTKTYNSEAPASGCITITQWDTVNKIFKATFNFTAKGEDCGTVCNGVTTPCAVPSDTPSATGGQVWVNYIQSP